MKSLVAAAAAILLLLIALVLESASAGATAFALESAKPCSFCVDASISCARCEGKGSRMEGCRRCNGEGQIRCVYCGGEGMRDCPMCVNGRTRWTSGDKDPCKVCGAIGSLKCECGPQLDTALATIAEHGGVVVYLRGHEGRGIGLINKLRAYRLQEGGLDTLDANLALGLPIDARDYTAASAILDDLGVEKVRLLTNNPEKVRQLEAHGIRVADRLPLVVGVGAVNAGYLETKRTRMGHAIDDGQLTDAAADELLRGHAS